MSWYVIKVGTQYVMDWHEENGPVWTNKREAADWFMRSRALRVVQDLMLSGADRIAIEEVA